MPIGYDQPGAPVHDRPHARLQYTLLGGRVAMRDRPGANRPAVDAVLLAAGVPAKAALRVLDAGCGGGAVGLCVAARLGAAHVTGVDLAADAVAQAGVNVAANGWQARFDLRQGDLRGVQDPSGFDVVVSNPPFHDRASSRPVQAARDRERFGDLALEEWLAHCLRLCRPRGRIIVILRADRIALALATLQGPAGDLRILPVHPFLGAPANRVVLHARKAVRTPAQLLAGLVLHEPDGGWTEAARQVLELGAPIDWNRGGVTG